MALSVFLLWHAYSVIDEYTGNVDIARSGRPTMGGSDFPAFYGGAKLFLSSPPDAYNDAAQARFILAAKRLKPEEDSSWYRYYNPPAYSLVLAPLTLLDVHDAYFVSLGLNTVGFLVLLFVIWRLLRERPLLFVFMAVGLFSATSVNYAFWHGQPTLWLAAVVGGVYVALEAGRPRLAGALASLLLFKPHWLFVPAITVWPLPKAALLSFAIGAAIMASPFLLVGYEGTREYIDLVLGRGRGDLADESFSEAVLSWSGFFRGLTRDAQPAPALAMMALTAALFVMVRRRGDWSLIPLAGALTLLLVVPHSHPQDWVMLAPGAAIMLRSQRATEGLTVTTLLLIGICLGLDHWSELRDRAFVTYWPTLAGFSLLIWVFFVSEVRQAHGMVRKAPVESERSPASARRLRGGATQSP